jgi:GT2 family glycosyltransferase
MPGPDHGPKPAAIADLELRFLIDDAPKIPADQYDAMAAHDMVSVIIAVYNAEDTLGRQLQALVDQTDAGDFEVVVALNRCTDRSRQVAEGFAERLALVIVDAPAQASCGYARNVGLASSRGDTLLFCDADDVVDHRWVAEMISAMEKQHVDVVGGKLVVDRSQIPMWIYRSGYEDLDGICLFMFGQIPFAGGGAMGIRRAALSAVGGFASMLPGTAGGGEDTDLGIRLWHAGFSVGKAPKALLVYTPRTTAWAFIRRQRINTETATALAIREHCVARSNLWTMISRPVAVGVHAVVLRREWRLRVVAMAMATNFYEHRTRRRLIAPTAATGSPSTG